MADVYYECLNDLINKQKYMIFKEQQTNSKIQYQKQNLLENKKTLTPFLTNVFISLPPNYILIKGTTTVPPIFIEFSDTKDTWYTTNPISLEEGYITLVGDGDQVTNDKPTVNGAIFLKKTMVPANAPANAPVNAPVNVPVQPKRIISKEVTQIFKKVLADPLPWEPNQWIELGEEQRTRNGNIILKDGRPLIEFWYINPTTKQSVYVLPEGGVIRDLAVSSSLGHELENLRNRLSARETTATQNATLNMASIVNGATTLQAAQAAVNKGVKESFIAKYSTHPQIKEAYERLVTPSSTPAGTLNLAEKYLKMKKMGVPVTAVIQKVNIASDLNNDQKENIIAQLQVGGQRGGLPPPMGLASLFATKTSGPPRPPSTPGPQPPSANSQATTLNEAGMGQLQDLVRQINNNAAYDVIDPTNPHELFICITGSCSVKPKYSESVLKVVTAGVTSTVKPESESTSAKLTINDFIAMKSDMDRQTLIAFMKSTYPQNDKQFNIDVQTVFPDINTSDITEAVASYEAKQKQSKHTVVPVQVNSSEKLKKKAAEALAKAVSGRKESGNAVTPYEEYTEIEISILNQIDALQEKEKEGSIPTLTKLIDTHKKTLKTAGDEGRIREFHVKQLLAAKKHLQEQKTKLEGLMKTPGLNEKIDFMRNKKSFVTTASNGRKVRVDPKARTVTNIIGGTRRKGTRRKSSKNTKTIKKYRR